MHSVIAVFKDMAPTFSYPLENPRTPKINILQASQIYQEIYTWLNKDFTVPYMIFATGNSDSMNGLARNGAVLVNAMLKYVPAGHTPTSLIHAKNCGVALAAENDIVGSEILLFQIVDYTAPCISFTWFTCWIYSLCFTKNAFRPELHSAQSSRQSNTVHRPENGVMSFEGVVAIQLGVRHCLNCGWITRQTLP